MIAAEDGDGAGEDTVGFLDFRLLVGSGVEEREWEGVDVGVDSVELVVDELRERFSGRGESLLRSLRLL